MTDTNRTDSADLSRDVETTALGPVEDKTLVPAKPAKPAKPEPEVLPTARLIPVILAHPAPEGDPGQTVQVTPERAGSLVRSGYARLV